MPPQSEQNLDLNDRVKLLEDQVKELMEYVKERKIQQITFPLDQTSADTIDDKIN